MRIDVKSGRWGSAAKLAPHRLGTAPALGLAGNGGLFSVTQAVTYQEMNHATVLAAADNQGKTSAALRPRLEALEDRSAPATLQVTSALDDVTKVDTLRYAVAHAGNGDKIVLKADVLASGITLTQGELLLTQQDLTIDTKAGPAPVTISGDNLSRIFEVAPGPTSRSTT